MKKLLSFILLLTACASPGEKSSETFPVLTVTEDEWATYEGRWKSDNGLISFELSLKSGAVGVDSYYVLHESIISSHAGAGANEEGNYSTTYGQPNEPLKIQLHNLNPDSKIPGLRFMDFQNPTKEAMFFMTRGNDELIPCDDHFEPITEDWHYTLHKRLNLVTVEGYLTFEQDSAAFFERNTRVQWTVAELGEFDTLKSSYYQLAKEKHEGIYLKALAYSVSDVTKDRTDALVIKRIVEITK